MSLPELSVPSTVSELRLLQVLRLMSSMRQDLVSDKSGITKESIERISFGTLWDLLSESLDFVRGLEGIVDMECKFDEDDVYNNCMEVRISPIH